MVPGNLVTLIGSCLVSNGIPIPWLPGFLGVAGEKNTVHLNCPQIRLHDYAAPLEEGVLGHVGLPRMRSPPHDLDEVHVIDSAAAAPTAGGARAVPIPRSSGRASNDTAALFGPTEWEEDRYGLTLAAISGSEGPRRASSAAADGKRRRSMRRGSEGNSGKTWQSR